MGGSPAPGVNAASALTDTREYTEYAKENIAALYGLRQNLELDIRAIKQALALDHVRCKTPALVRRELWVTLLACNLIRNVIATSAAVHDKQPRCLSFSAARQTILASWTLWSTGWVSNAGTLHTMMLTQIAAHEVAHRPGRIEPRVLKRRRHHYALMKRPREERRAELGKT